MIKESFCLFAIEILSKNSVGKRKLHAKKPYYLRKGYSLSEGELRIDYSLMTPTNLYDVYCGDDGTKHPHITLSAIVGENGAGKSTLVEFLIRLLNNLAAYSFGDKVVFPGAEHIHHINGVYGAIYYIVDEIPYCLELKDKKVSLYEYKYSHTDKQAICYNKSDNRIDWHPSKRYNPSRIAQVNHMQMLYDKLYYTVVSNYSIYSYNTSDFSAENNTVAEERLCRYPNLSLEEREKKTVSDDERNWLRGIFEKNDGYQMPIVVTPYRSNGCIDINDENELAAERLTSLVVFTQFKTINEHLDVYEFRFSEPEKNKVDWVTRCYELVVNNCGLVDLSLDDFRQIANLLIRRWGAIIHENIVIDSSAYSDVAKEYLVYKTLKVIHKYSSHRVCHNQLCRMIEYRNTNLKGNQVKNYYKPWVRKTIRRLSGDHSHLTKKIRSTLAYFKYKLYDGTPWKIEDLGVRMGESFFLNNLRNKSQSFLRIEDMVPPPFIGTSLVLRDKITKDEVAFETLSSGEKQMAYATSSIVYHLHNISSASNEHELHRLHYRYVNCVLEEIELYFHPEMQKKFVRYLLDTIRQVDLSNLKGINIVLVTHSPFVLSDIPSSSILTLRREEHKEDNEPIETFGTNIHTLLKNGFFMQEGTIGDYAQWMCDYILVVLKLWTYFRENPDAAYIDEPLSEQICEPIINEHVYWNLVNYVHDDCVWICKDKFKQKHTAQWIKTCIDTFENRLIREALYNQYLCVFPEQNAQSDEVEELKLRLEQLTGGHVYVETK